VLRVPTEREVWPEGACQMASLRAVCHWAPRVVWVRPPQGCLRQPLEVYGPRVMVMIYCCNLGHLLGGEEV
jgi:hypothetical protein